MKNVHIRELDRIWHHLFSFSRRMMAEGNYPLSRMGLDDVTILARIGSTEDARLAVLCRELSMPKSTMTSLAKRLEMAGYLTRNTSLEDRREFVLRLTDAGKSLLDDHERYERLVYEHMLQGLDSDEQVQLMKLLRKGCGMGDD